MSDSIEPRVYIISWNDLGKWLAKGLRMIQVTPGPGSETTMLAVVPDELVAELEKRSRKHKGKVSLKDMLIDMAGWAGFKRGEVRRTRLGGGLGIDVICGLDDMWRLQIWREGIPPSLREWETVISSWPTELPPQIGYKRFTHNNRQYIRAEWKVMDEQIQTDLPGGDTARKDDLPGATDETPPV